MIFPIGDTQVVGGQKALFAYGLIVLNIFIFAIQLSYAPGDSDPFEYITDKYAAKPFVILNGQDLYTLVSSMFLHGGFAHLASNMLYLWTFADNIEAVIGSFRFLVFYLLGGVAAALTHVLLFPMSQTPMVGASGAISAVMGAYLVMFPKSRIKVLVVYLFRNFHVSAYTALILWIAIQLINGFGGLSFFSGGEGRDSGGVAYWAHIGGFVFGLFAGYLFKPMAEKYEFFEEGYRERDVNDGKYFPT